MESMDELRKQHEEILSIVDKILSGLETAADIKIAETLFDLIGQLGTLLEEHLLIEDFFLYPALKKLPQENVRNIASLFLTELGGIKNAFTDYSNKWTSPKNITQLHSYFISESKILLGTLQHRISKENNDLFPLIGA